VAESREQYDCDFAKWQRETYAEGVYFHEFVQNFLFAKQSGGRLSVAPFRLFQRQDVSEVLVDIDSKGAFRLAVERLNLYLFRSGAAILVLEVSSRLREPVADGAAARPWHLSDVQNFHDYFRRAYVPYAAAPRPGTGGSSMQSPYLVVRSVVWRHGDDRKPEPFCLCDAVIEKIVKGYLAEPPEKTRGRRYPPVFEHWRWLLKDTLPIAPDDDPEIPGGVWWKGEGRWHHVVDERMPTLATVAVTGSDQDPYYYYRNTRRGDRVRLCFADDAGADPYFYDPKSLVNFERDHTYRLFEDRGTVFLASGYAFVAYGAGPDFEKYVAAHMRRHYSKWG
jgi:hypothetical protein